jgi:sigma-B regulation protein RsbU (phosphoserine phosphatase)
MNDAPGGDPLYEDAACGLLLTQADGTILHVNRTFCTWLGRVRDDLVGQRLDTLLTIGGRIFHQTHWMPLLKMQRSLSEVKLEMKHADGQRVPMVMNAVIRTRDGREFHELAVFSARDRHKYELELLKARERAEEHLRNEQESQKALAEARAGLELAIDAAQLFQWSVHMPDRERRYDPSVALLLGYSDRRVIEPAEFTSRIVADDRHAEAGALDAFLDAPLGRFQVVFRVLGVDGVQRWIASWGRPRPDASGSTTHLGGLLQDVTQSQRQRAEAEDRALLAEQTLGIVGHDLRNPLAAIQMASEILGLRVLDGGQQFALGERIRSSARRANRLIADLLDFTRARTGRSLNLSKTVVDCHVVARDVVAELSTAHPARLLRHTDIGDTRMTADGDRIGQALGNLISNGLTYGSPDTAVTVSSEGREHSVRLSVHNQGMPIDPGLRPTLFEPMTRGESAGHLRSVGLGLYIVREIAVAHGGHVDYMSDEASGTTFFIELPRLDL